jgi:negative regulator of flagellin synthesis FlgM
MFLYMLPMEYLGTVIMSSQARKQLSESPETANRVSLGDAEQLEKLAAAVMSLPNLRKEKVEALRRRVESGEYEVTDAQIADALLQDQRS